MTKPSLPLVILGGRDRRGSTMPDAGREKHQLKGYKAVDIRIGGRPLISLVVERWRQSGAFDPIYVAGPESIYRPVAEDFEIIDTDSSVVANLRAAGEHLIATHPGSSVAFSTCDILPDVDELRLLMNEYWENTPCDFWVPQIRAPKETGQLGESSWKPQYRIIPRGEQESVDTLPGHLIVADSNAVRYKLLFHMLELAYRSRNKPISYRRTYILQRILLSLFWEDLKGILRLHPPLITWEIVSNGLALARGLREGELDELELGRLVRNIYVFRHHRRQYPKRLGRLPVLPGLSLAKDIDTEEEAREVKERLERGN